MRKKLIEAGIEVMEHPADEFRVLKMKINELRKKGQSYQAIADLFNLWKISTRTGAGVWYSKTVREIANQ